MYYGIASGAEVYVSSGINYQDIHTWNSLDSLKLPIDREWRLTSIYDGMTVRVSVKTYGNDDRRVIISALLAPLKQIDDGMIYNASASAIETNLGFKVDRDIPAEIGRIDNMIAGKDKIQYDISIDKTIDINFVKEPEMFVEHLTDKYIFRVYLIINGNKNHLDISEDLWIEDGNLAIKHAREMLLLSFYENHWSPSVTLFKYQMFQDEMNHPAHSSLADAGLKYTDYVSKKPQKEHKGVYQLPGLSETVKNPVSGLSCTLKTAIIHLNDSHGWSREQIADWLETLDVDISFKMKEEK